MPQLFDRELDRHQLGFAIAETVAHLNFLLAEGRIERCLDADERLRYQRR
jgi:hypothetical protein